MRAKPEQHRNWVADLDLRSSDEEDEFQADDTYAAGIDTLAEDFADDDDEYDSVDIITDELNLMGIHSASDFN